MPHPFVRRLARHAFTVLAALALVDAAEAQEKPTGGTAGTQGTCTTCYLVSVTPDGDPIAAPDGVSQQAVFMVENVGSKSISVTLACSVSGALTCGPVSPASLSIPAYAEPRAVTVTFTATGLGTLRLTASGSATDQGSYQVTYAARPTLALRNRPDELDRARCVTTAAGPGANQCGDLLLAHAMPAYRTLGRDRALTLVYNSGSAWPRPVVVLAVTQVAGAAAPTSVVARLKVNGTLVAAATYEPWSTGTRQIALSFDAGSYPTSLADYVVEVENRYATVAPQTASAVGRLLIVNDGTSLFGRGWTMAGIERVYLIDGGTRLFWRGAGGTARIYDGAGPNAWRAPAGAYRDTIVLRPDWVFERRLRHGVKVLFDGCGRQVATISRTGQQTSFTWPAGCGAEVQDTLKTITVPPGTTGGTYQFAYPSPSTMTVTDPAGRVLTLTFDGNRYLRDLRDPDGVSTTMQYHGSGPMASHTGRRGFTTWFTYGNVRQLTGVAAPFGPPTAVSMANSTYSWWDGQGLAYGTPGGTLPQPPDTAAARIVIDGPRTDVIDVTTVATDSWGAPTALVDALGATTRFARDSARYPALVTRVTYPNGRIVRQSYDSTDRANLVETRDSTLHLAYGRATRVTRFFYDSVTTLPFALTRVYDPLDRLTRYEYSPTLRLPVATINQQGHRTEFSYVTTGALVGQLAAVSEKDVETWEEAPDASDDASTTDALRDHVTRLGYDDKGNVDSVASPAGLVTAYQNDVAGRAIRRWDPLNTLTEMAFDPMNRVLRQDEYTAAQPLSHPFGLTIGTMACDVTQIVCADSTWLDPNGALPTTLRSTFSYQPWGLESVTGPGGPSNTRRSYSYDANGGLLAEVDEDGRTDSKLVDPTSALQRAIDRRGRTVFTRLDVLGRPISQILEPVVYGERQVPGDTISFMYDAVTGWLTQTRNRNSVITRQYFPDGTLRSRSAQSLVGTGQPTDIMEYTYDQASALLTRTHNGDLTDFAYTAAGTLATMTLRLGAGGDGVVRTFTFAWDQLGRRRQLDYPNGVVVKYRYDKLGTLRRVISVHPDGAPASSLRFAYRADVIDPLGRLLQSAAVCSSQATHGPCVGVPSPNRFRYNRRGMALLSGGDSTRYDQAGSLVAKFDSRNAVWATFGIAANSPRVVSTTEQGVTRQFGWDENGSRVYEQYVAPIQPYRGYYYDGLNRTSGLAYMKYASGQQGGTFHDQPDDCRYDADGNVLLVCDGSGVPIFYDGAVPVAARNTNRWQFVQGPGLDDPLLAYSRLCNVNGCALDWRIVYFITDGAGRQFAAGGNNGTIPDAINPSSSDFQSGFWGWDQAGGTTMSFGFQAQRQSPAGSRFALFRNRLYDPETGRWTQEDPLGVAGGVNLYQFNGNNPVMFTDPFGLCPECKKRRESIERTSGTTSPGLLDPVAIVSGAAAGRIVTALGGAGVAAAADGGTVTFFRGVSQAEASDVVENGLRAGASAMGNTGKYLTNTVEAAGKWGAQNGPGSQILKVTVPADATKAFTSLGRMDGIGQAWWAPMESLKDASVEVVNQMAKQAVP